MSEAQAPPFVKKDFSTLVNSLLEEVKHTHGGRHPVTDHHEGSVVRTLIETFAHEMAVAYEQLERVYNNAYLDSAQGASLDKVVDLLAIQRYQAGRLEGVVTFSRATPAPEAIHIPAGTLVAGKGFPVCTTLQAVTLEKGMTAVTAIVNSQEAGAESIPAKTLNTMPRPISGIEKVINAGELITRQRAETDDELRERSRRTIQASRSGTRAALEEAVRALGLKHIKVLEYTEQTGDDEPKDADRQTPGMIRVIVGDAFDTDKNKQDTMKLVEERIMDVKPAGVMVRCQAARLIEVSIVATLVLSTEQDRHQQQEIERDLNKRIRKYFAGLTVGESLYEEKIKALLLNHPDVSKFEPDSNPLRRIIEATPPEKALSNIKTDERAVLAKGAPPRLILQNPDIPVWLQIEMTGDESNKERWKTTCEKWIQSLGKSDNTLLSALWEGFTPDFCPTQVGLTFIYPLNGSVIERKLPRDYDKEPPVNKNSRVKPELKQFKVVKEVSS